MAIRTKSKSHLFRSYRALQGLSQREVAEALGEPQHYVSFLETGKAIPPLKIAKKICRLLKAPLEELFPELRVDGRPSAKGRRELSQPKPERSRHERL